MNSMTAWGNSLPQFLCSIKFSLTPLQVAFPEAVCQSSLFITLTHQLTHFLWLLFYHLSTIPGWTQILCSAPLTILEVSDLFLLLFDFGWEITIMPTMEQLVQSGLIIEQHILICSGVTKIGTKILSWTLMCDHRGTQSILHPMG